MNIGTWIFTPSEIDHASRKFGVDGSVTLLANGSRIEAGSAVYIEDKGVGLAQRAELIDPRLNDGVAEALGVAFSGDVVVGADGSDDGVGHAQV